jgi:transcriptional regulator with XRE-family HTH domain
MTAMSTYNSCEMTKDKIRKELGKKIKALRTLKGYTQERLGERAGLSYKFVGEVERGTVNVSLDSLYGIAKALGVTISDLFNTSKEPFNVIVTERSPLSRLSVEEISTINQSIKLLGKMFSKL